MSVTKVSSAMQDLTDDYAFSGTVTGAGNPARGTIGGLNITNDGTDAAHDLGIAVGFARDYTDAATMSLTGALIKRADATWAVGTNAGGMDSTDTIGNNTGYGVYLIRRSDTGVVDVLISSDMTSAGSALTMPTNYDQKRLIGWVRTDGSANIITFKQTGDYFKLAGVELKDLNDGSITASTYETATLTCPPSCIANLAIYVVDTSSSSGSQYFWIRPVGSSWGVGGGSAYHSIQGGAWTFDSFMFKADFMVNASSQLQYAASENSTTTVDMFMKGCNMLTRSNPL